MQRHDDELMTIDGELRAPGATVQLVRWHLPEPVDYVLVEEKDCRLDLCLTPRPHDARACYLDRWSPHRFERIGEVFVLPPGEPLHVRSDRAHQASIVCELHPEPMRQWLDGDLEWTERRLEASLDFQDANVRSLLLRLAEETRHPGFAGQMLAELIVAQ